MPDSAAAILDMVNAETGLVFPSSRRAWSDAALADAREHLGLPSIEALSHAVKHDRRAFEDVVDRLTVGETYFFRHREQFEFVFREAIEPVLAARSGPVSIWSAACSTGDEPYSLAIMAAQRGVLDRLRILGTDVSNEALRRCGKGRYSRWSLRSTDPATRERWFTTVPGINEFELDARIRESVRFRPHNLASDDWATQGIGGFDVVFCRNVLIYFDDDGITRVANQLHGALKQGGWLITAASDRELHSLAPLHGHRDGTAIYYRRDDSRRWDPVPFATLTRADEAPFRARSSASTESGADDALAAWDSRPADPIAPDPPPPSSARRADGERRTTSLARAAKTALRMHDVTRALELTDDAASAELAAIHLQALGAIGDPVVALESGLPTLLAHEMSPEVQLVYGLLQLSAGRTAEARATLRRSLYLDRELPFVHFALATAELADGDRESAVRSFRNAARLLGASDPQDTVPWSEGATYGALAEAARGQLERLANDSRRSGT